MRFYTFLTTLSFILPLAVFAQGPGGTNRVVLTNDDGWAVAQIRAEYDVLRAAGYDVCANSFVNFAVHT